MQSILMTYRGLQQTDEESLTLDCMILYVFISHGGGQSQSVTPDTGSDVRHAERQSAAALFVNESRHGSAFRTLVRNIKHTSVMKQEIHKHVFIYIIFPKIVSRYLG